MTSLPLPFRAGAPKVRVRRNRVTDIRRGVKYVTSLTRVRTQVTTFWIKLNLHHMSPNILWRFRLSQHGWEGRTLKAISDSILLISRQQDRLQMCRHGWYPSARSCIRTTEFLSVYISVK